MELRDCGVVITGASRGLGAALALRMAAEGAHVALIARGGEELERVVQRVRSLGRDAHAVRGDIGDKRAVHGIAAQVTAALGQVDVVVHNASTLGHTPLRPWLDTECEALEEALAVNVIGPLRLTKLLAGPMVLRGKGLLVHITSDAAIAAYPAWGAYAATKAALDSMARTLGAELEGTGVRSIAVDPGEMDTRMHADAIPDADRASLLDPDVVAARIVRLVRAVETLPTGARVEAAQWAGA